ncbi:uncharacterized protein SPPG_00865 [Spizellomyces punctatus DAOM BR117]|uniref:ABC transporter domain-containing protein n=1 Tax=Spizellomyces punctatus (strain DAOM BR117) TaxID=645134 RepID=A0A0L0HWB7_SPIPD|nr:uncharacterized protein SPPG_00865 [Spizellomyces punctatus DAOM BR117]KND05205.1 hypothetical protein SPPG_00865 [Spizellomyces punctatus DAOM BR117]|eukprot:XP_016613244.1 hypothetical protein SPPG_00865 [Spizellomyces punctatus DAOM BR117]
MSNMDASVCLAGNTTVPVIISDRHACDPGYYCPHVDSKNPASLPSYCAPTDDCQLLRLQGKACQAQGLYEPVVCPSGYYCPDWKTMIRCPSGYYCHSGSSAPIKCDSLSICGEGTHSQMYYGPLIFALLLDFVLFAFVLARRVAALKASETPLSVMLPAWSQRFLRKDADVKETENMVAHQTIQLDLIKKDDPEIVPYSPRERSVIDTSCLVKGFSRALGGRTDLSMNFKFRNLSLVLPDGKPILSGVTGEIRPGRMTAIMGPSGAGKTTFMNVLMGKVKRTGGTLYVNGQESEMHVFRKVIGYVPQEDIMLRELTVWENVLHSAKIRLPGDWSAKDVEEHVHGVLSALNLSHVAHTIIGDETTRGVSGGQRKRVNIGMELAAVPLAIFLDEPTSGLDATAALDVADIMSSLTHLGLTLVAVIHQPRVEIFERFDDLLMIAPGGLTAYLGPVNEAKTYFEAMGFQFAPTANTADVLMDILSGRGINNLQNITVDDLVVAWEKRSAGDGDIDGLQSVSDTEFHEHVPTLRRTRGANIFWQIYHCHNRYLVQQERTLSSLVLEVFVGTAAGLLMGVAMADQGELYYGVWKLPYTKMSPAPLEYIVALYGLLIGMSIGLAGAPAGVKVFGEEKPVFWREAAAGHSRFSYYVGKTIGTVYRFTLSSLHFSAVYYFFAQPLVPFAIQYVLILLQFFGVYGVAATVSTIVKRDNAALLAVVVGLFHAVFSGFGPTLVQARDWGIDFLWAISFNKWAAEAQYSESIMPFKDVYLTEESAKVFGYVTGRTTLSVVLMLAIGCVWRIIAFVLLTFVNRDKQR